MTCFVVAAKTVGNKAFPTTLLQFKRALSTHQNFKTAAGSINVDLRSHSLVGVAQSRGERLYQEDAYSINSISLPTIALNQTAKEATSLPIELRQQNVASTSLAQVACFSVFDGHGGSQVSTYLRDNLDNLIEQADPNNVNRVISLYSSLGGYLHRYTGGPLKQYRSYNTMSTSSTPSSSSSSFSSTTTTNTATTANSTTNSNQLPPLTIEQRATLAFLEADLAVCNNTEIEKAGSVGTVAMLHSLCDPSLPFFASPSLLLCLAHVGDTVAVLCSADSGTSTRLTETHHAESKSESDRLSQTGSGLITDSFGEARWAGYVANTRAVGDRPFKRVGVYAQPEFSTRVLHDASRWSFLVLMTDGISSVVSDQEVVDLCRDRSDPSKAAQSIVSYAEDIGTEDNATCIVIPLPGWKKIGGHDSTVNLREFRLRQTVSNRSRRM